LAFCAASTCHWLMSSFFSRTPKSFSVGLLSISYFLYMYPGLPQHRCKTLPCRWPWWTSLGSQGPTFHVHPGPPGRCPFFPLLTTAPLSLVSSANLLRGHSTHYLCHPMSSIKTLKSTGPKRDCWGHHTWLAFTWTQSHWSQPFGCDQPILHPPSCYSWELCHCEKSTPPITFTQIFSSIIHNLIFRKDKLF